MKFTITAFRKEGEPDMYILGEKDRYDRRWQMYRPTAEELLVRGWIPFMVKNENDLLFIVGEEDEELAKKLLDDFKKSFKQIA